MSGDDQGSGTPAQADGAGLNLDAIEARAQAATPGPWRESVLGSEGYAVYGPQGSRADAHRLHTPTVARCGREDWETDKANAAHIAGMDPATTLALVAEVRRLRAQVEAARDWNIGLLDPEPSDAP